MQDEEPDVFRHGTLVELEPAVGPAAYPRLVDGAAFLLDGGAEDLTAVWGTGTAVAWAAGESLLIAGPQGVGKSTLLQQLALARCGLLDNLLGMPVVAGERRTLYLAADRPKQIARSMRRMVTDDNRATLTERLRVHTGPLPFDLADHDALANLAEHVDADTLLIDSLKDITVGLADDVVGARLNLALQEVVARGIEVAVTHHQRKQQQGAGKPKTLSDVYGSTWITSGAGSVLLLWGDAGDPIVELTHLKQPLDEIGPHNVVHDHARGETTLHEPVDLATVLWQRGTEGLTAAAAAAQLFGTDSRAAIEKARRRLSKLVDSDDAMEFPSLDGGPITYVSTRAGATET